MVFLTRRPVKMLFSVIGATIMLSACASSPNTPQTNKNPNVSVGLNDQQTFLPDKAAFYQKDPRWAKEPLGTSKDTLASDGCLVTAASMALANLGFQTDPSDLNKRLTQTKSFTPRGWLIWDGIRKVTGGKAKARFYKTVNEDLIMNCMSDGYYPLVQFYLPNGRSHWAMILHKSKRGFHMRDPLRRSTKPLIFPHSSDKFRALRCIGLA